MGLSKSLPLNYRDSTTTSRTILYTEVFFFMKVYSVSLSTCRTRLELSLSLLSSSTTHHEHSFSEYATPGRRTPRGPETGVVT